SDNSLHVLDLSNDSMLDDTIIDGFVITGGNASGVAGSQFGGGIRVQASASPTIRCCRIIGNQGDAAAGIAISGPGTAPVIHNCFLCGNGSTGSGGAIGVLNGASEARLMSCTIAHNSAGLGGGVGLDPNTAILIGDSILFFNKDDKGTDETSQIAFDASSLATIDTCCLPNQGAAVGAVNSIGNDPLFVNLAGPDGLFGTLDDSAALSSASTCIGAGD